MHICYFDESGCVGTLPSIDSPVSPVLVIGAVALDSKKLRAITLEFLALKKRYFPKLCPDQQHDLSWIKAEIKGSSIRSTIAKPSRNPKRGMLRFMREILDLLLKHDAKIWGRIWIKKPGEPVDGVAVYTSSVQSLYGNFQQYLLAKDARGCVIGDSRDAKQNSKVAHSIFTQKYSKMGDKFDRIVELPSFAHSENTCGLQIADLLASGLLFPIAIETYCSNHSKSLHVRDYSDLKKSFAHLIRDLQFRYTKESRKVGGIVVSDNFNRRPGHLFFDISQCGQAMLSGINGLTSHPTLSDKVGSTEKMVISGKRSL